MSVGIREFRNSLSKYLDAVKAGESITVTEHGKPVAEVRPIGRRTTYEQLIADGRISPPQRNSRGKLPDPIRVKGGVSDLIAEQRR